MSNITAAKKDLAKYKKLLKGLQDFKIAVAAGDLIHPVNSRENSLDAVSNLIVDLRDLCASYADFIFDQQNDGDK